MICMFFFCKIYFYEIVVALGFLVPQQSTPSSESVGGLFWGVGVAGGSGQFIILILDLHLNKKF